MPASPRSTLSLDALWQARLLIWTLLAGEGLAVILALAPGIAGNRWVYFGIASLAVQWILLLTLGSMYLLRRRLATWRPLHIANLALLILVVSTWLVVGSSLWLLRDLWPMSGPARMQLLARMTALALTVGVLGLAALQNHWRARQMALRAKQAELDALRARIHPHFLFNTLNTATALVRVRPADAEVVLMDLADLFRAALSGRQEALLAEEIALVRQHLQIEALRFGERLRVEWELPEPLPSVMLPTLSIQPLVENAIRHGVEPSPSGGWIRIRVQRIDAIPPRLEISVRNSVPTGPRSAPGHGVGLKAVAARIEEFSGGSGSVRTTTDTEGFVATVSLPLETNPG